MLLTRTENDRAILEIHSDEAPEDPRQWDNLGTMICFHRSYDLGDKHSFKTPQELREQVTNRNAIILPLYLMDHSGITIRTDPTMFQACDPAGWDWRQLGWIYASYEKIHKEYGVKRITKAVRDRVISALEAEVETYDQYLRGDVYGYVLHDKDTDKQDNCWGFYGDPKTNGMADNLGEHAVLLNHLAAA